jgi:hypothetical protein
VLFKKKRDSNHEWEEKVHRKNISKEGQNIVKFGQRDLCESLQYKILCLCWYNCQLEKNKSEIISSIYEITSLSQKRPAQVNDNGKVIDEKVYEWFMMHS